MKVFIRRCKANSGKENTDLNYKRGEVGKVSRDSTLIIFMNTFTAVILN
jgi:hypothetical protein